MKEITNPKWQMVIVTSRYTIRYRGGRLADVEIPGAGAVECVQVRDYDVQTGEFGPVPSRSKIKRRVTDFLSEAGGIDLYYENCLPPYGRMT